MFATPSISVYCEKSAGFFILSENVNLEKPAVCQRTLLIMGVWGWGRSCKEKKMSKACPVISERKVLFSLKREQGKVYVPHYICLG